MDCDVCSLLLSFQIGQIVLISSKGDRGRLVVNGEADGGDGGGWFCICPLWGTICCKVLAVDGPLWGGGMGVELIVLWFSLFVLLFIAWFHCAVFRSKLKRFRKL